MMKRHQSIVHFPIAWLELLLLLVGNRRFRLLLELFADVCFYLGHRLGSVAVGAAEWVDGDDDDVGGGPTFQCRGTYCLIVFLRYFRSCRRAFWEFLSVVCTLEILRLLNFYWDDGADIELALKLGCLLIRDMLSAELFLIYFIS